MTTWTSIATATGTGWTNTTNPQGQQQYDESTLSYDDSNAYYDSVNPSYWTSIAAASGTGWTSIATAT